MKQHRTITIIGGALAFLVAACGAEVEESSEPGHRTIAVTQTNNTELIVYGQALDRYAASVEAGGSSGWRYRWRVGSARFVITPAGVRLKGQLLAEVLKAVAIPTVKQLKQSLSTATFTWTAIGTQPFDLPVAVTHTGGTVRLQVSSSPVTVRDSQGQSLFSVVLGAHYSTNLRITPDPFTAGTTSVLVVPTQVLIEPGNGYLRLSAQLRVN
jgi:hypothetical protein